MLEYHSDYRCYLIPQAGVCAYNFQNLKMLNRTIIWNDIQYFEGQKLY